MCDETARKIQKSAAGRNQPLVTADDPWRITARGTRGSGPVMTFAILHRGTVCRMPAGTDAGVVAGPRTAVLDGGEIVCTFVAQTATGSNDFKPMLRRSTDGGITWTEADWTNFAFGEPSATVLPNWTVLVTLWRLAPGGAGEIAFVKLRIEETS